MRNYVIINGVNSLTIQGLAIKTMPPITKPLMRTMREEIDGRDGDINTELGYQAYDKPLEVGLFGSYDINEIIAFFNSKGTIVFSDEPDKFYNFEILDKIDFTRLVKFRSAIVNIHCQPFKYPLSETPIEVAYEYVEGTGENITLNNTEASSLGLELKGNTNQVSYTGKNLFNLNDTNVVKSSIVFTINGDTFTQTNTGTYCRSTWQFDNLTIGSKYTFSCDFSNQNASILSARAYDSTNTTQIASTGSISTTSGTMTMTFTATETTHRIRIYSNSSGDQNTYSVTFSNTQFEKSDTKTSYEPYVGGIPSPNPNYPQDIHVVSGDNEVVIEGVNLVRDKFVDSRTDAYITSLEVDMEFKPNTAYTFSFEGTANNKLYANEYLFVESANFTIGSGRTTITRTTRNDLTKSTYQYDTSRQMWKVFKNQGVQGGGNVFNNLQIQIGNEATPYEEHTIQRIPLYLGVENLFSGSLYNAQVGSNGGISSNTQRVANVNVGGTSDFYLQAGTYTLSIPNLEQCTCLTKNSGGTILDNFANSWQTLPFTFTTTQAGYLYFTGRKANSSVLTPSDYSPQVEKGDKVNHASSTPIELALIPNTDYKDVFVKEGETWYKREAVGKVVMDGTEEDNQYSVGTSGGVQRVATNLVVDTILPYTDTSRHIDKIICSHFKGKTTDSVGSMYQYQRQVLFDTTSDITSVALWKTWLTTHNVTLRYVKKEAEDIEITGTLADQLEAIKNALSYNGQTNITQTNNDKPFIISASALKKGSDTALINNQGNIYSKPTIELEGTGVVNIYKDGSQAFEVDLTEENNITIDTEQMEAYTPNNTLANRKVTGDYSKFKIEAGENEVKFDGALTSATITNYKRWL